MQPASKGLPNSGQKPQPRDASQQKQLLQSTQSSKSVPTKKKTKHQILRQFKLISVNFKEAALDSPSFRASVNHLDIQLSNIEQWLVAISSSLKKMPRYIKEVETFCNSFLEYLFPSFLQEGFINQEYSSQALQATLAGLKEIWGRSLFALNLNPSVLNELIQFRTTNVVKYRELRQRFESSQRKYDRYTSVFASSSKSKDAVMVMEDAKQLYQVRKEYLHVSLDLVCELQNLSGTLDRLLVSLVTSLWEKKYSIFAMGQPNNPLRKNYDQIKRVSSWSNSIVTASDELRNDMLLARKQVEDGSNAQFQPSLNANDYKVATISYKSLRNINEPAFEKHGYLFMKTWTEKSPKTIWVRRWCFIKNGVFGMYLLSPEQTSVQESDKIGIFLCNMRYAPNEDRRFCFDIKTSDTTITLQAEALIELKSWLKVFENEKDRISALPPEDDLFRVASTRFPPIFAEFASTENTTMDQELSSSKIVNSTGQTIVSSSMIRNVDRFCKLYGVNLYADMPRVHPPFMTDRTKDSFVAYCSSFRAIDIPQALTANVWGSVNWGLYYLQGAIDRTDIFPRAPIVRDDTMIEFQEKYHGSAVPYPQFYPRELITFDIQMRALFETIVEAGEYCIMSFCCIWAPNSKQELSGRCFLTTRHVYFYMQALGFVALYKSYIGESVSVEVVSQTDFDTLKVYYVDGVIKLKLFMEDAKMIKTKYLYLIDNIISDSPKNLQGVLNKFKEIEAQVHQEAQDKEIIQEINNLTKNLSNKALINNRLLIGGDAASISPNKRGTVTSYRVDFTPQFYLVGEKTYPLPPKAVFHALLGDDSDIFNRETATVKFGFQVKKPWRFVNENGNNLYRRGVMPVLLNGKKKQLEYNQVIERMDDNTYYVFTHKLSQFSLGLGSPFTTVGKFVVVGTAGKRTKIYFYSQTTFEHNSPWNPLIKQIVRSISLDQVSKINYKLKNAVKAIGTHGQIVKAIYLYGKLSHTNEPDTEVLPLKPPTVQLGMDDCKTTVTYWTVHRGNSLASEFVKQNPLLLQRAVYSQDVMDEFKSKMSALNSTVSSSKPFELFEAESFTYNYQNLSKLFNDDETLSNSDTQEIHKKLRAEFRAIGVERYNLLVELRLLQNKEKEITQREFTNWLLNEIDRCDSMQEPMQEESKVYPSIVGGKEIFNEDDEIVVKSASNEILHRFAHFSISDKSMNQLIINAKEGFSEWSSIPTEEKVRIFNKTQVLLKERRSEFVESHLEIGGPGWFADFNVDGTIDQLQEYTSQLSRSPGEIVQSSHNDLALTVKQPIGPVLSISPWNAPVILAGRSILAPLAAGCSVIHKSSEKSPRSSYLLVKCFLDAGVPPKALQLVHLKPEENPVFIDDVLKSGAIKKVNFTGSTMVGRKIAEKCGRYLIPYLLELGGKNLSIVLSDANLDKAAGAILFGAWSHRGQICMSTDKVFVDEEIYGKFKSKLVEVAQEFSKDKDHQLSHRDVLGRDKVMDLVEDAIQKGAKLVYGSFDKNKILKSNVIEPMVLEDADSSMSIYTQETFGPVFTIHKFKDVEDVITEVNNHSYGLKGAVWSTNIIKALNIAKKLEIGGVHINSPTISDEATVPHGGVKSSGVGRFNSHWGMDEFSIIKAITINE
ncbi:SIP3 [Candida margitis]|uniref:SIP3 n=1 Tax=Candida margitis TaxID=1775924 RepID=UPI0022276415|nr:SIP3 [Candida margitis]KAI5961751.1 SIP3 [Candida margitis]